MIAIKDLKVGDIVCTIYHEGKLGYSGVVRRAKITNITDKKIDVVSENGTKLSFHNDGKYEYIGLEYSTYQFLNLFLGTVEEGVEFDKERVLREELYLEAYNLFMENARDLPVDKLKGVINLLK